LVSDRHEVQVVTFSVDRDIKKTVYETCRQDNVLRIKPTYLNYNNKFPVLCGKDIANRIRDLKPDIVHIRGWYQLSVIESIIDKLKNSSIIIIWHGDGLHESHEYFKENPRYKRLIRKAIDCKVKFWSNSIEDSNLFLSLGIASNRIFFTPPIIGKFIKFNHKNFFSPKILTLARFFKYKSHEDVFRVANKINTKAEVILAGAADTDFCKELIRKLDRKNVTFVLNPSDDLVGKLYSFATHFVLASKKETLGISTLEAVYAGCVPLARNIGGISTYLPQDLLFKHYNEFKNKLKNILFPSIASQKVTELEKIRKQLSRNRIKKQIEKIYESIK
jgi:glycosyltransferase involved in cell wall biosynthesis